MENFILGFVFVYTSIMLPYQIGKVIWKDEDKSYIPSWFVGTVILVIAVLLIALIVEIGKCVV